MAIVLASAGTLGSIRKVLTNMLLMVINTLAHAASAQGNELVRRLIPPLRPSTKRDLSECNQYQFVPCIVIE